MKSFRKVIAVILVFIMSVGLFPGALQKVFAAPTSINILVDSFSAGTLRFHWDTLSTNLSTKITYHTPASGGGADFNTITLSSPTTNTYSISGLKSDYIYDIKVSIDDGINGREGFLYFLPQITFTASCYEQSRAGIQGGGFEIGADPRLKLKWAMPKVYNGTDFVYANDPTVLSYMGNAINNVYNDGRQISTMDFKVNISTDFSVLNTGSIQSSILIGYGNSNYTTQVSGYPLTTSTVTTPDSNGFMYFDLLGRRDKNAALPAADQYGLPDGDILPGTVYYMNIKPIFKNAGNQINAVTVGPPSSLNGSLLTGATNYTYTPIRFEVTKDSANNLYLKIYKINQGTLDLPRLFYEVQSSDDPSIVGDWSVKKTLDDSYFGGGFAYSIISGINPSNEIYYKIVVKSDGASDRIESSKLLYTINEDTSRPPVPRGVNAIATNLHTGTVTVNNSVVTVKSSDIKISWDKPTNWDQIKANTDANKDVVFHMLLSINSSDITGVPDPMLESDGVKYGNFPVKYRLEKFVSSKFVTENGNRLEYTLDGIDLFKGIDFDGNIINIPNPGNYPAFLLPNKIYYLEMYTTTGANKGSVDPNLTSDKSIGTSFTTLTGVDMDIPLPSNFKVNKNDRDPAKLNFIELQFDKVKIDWANYSSDSNAVKNIYYDIYMSTRTDLSSFTRIATTEGTPGDVALVGDQDPLSTFVTATVKNFSAGTLPYDVFGGGLLPNTTYYFIAKTRLDVQGENEKISMATAILSVTTVRGDTGDPDDSGKKPLAPTDFSIARDSSGNLLLTGQTVTFNWLRKETGTSYQLVCSSTKVLPYDDETSFASDSVYQSYISNFDKGDTANDGKLILNPDSNPLVNNFEFDYSTKTCKFTINKWLFPNRLYYFSIRAVKAGKESVWVSIPVTTSLIQQPTLLIPIDDSQIGFYWSDNSQNMVAEDYKVYLKGPKDTGYNLITRVQSTVVKDSNNYYARVFNLTANSLYSVRVYKGANNSTLVYEKTGIVTRDDCHQLDVKWRGLLPDQYSRYEIAIKTVDATDYTTLTNEDMEQYTDPNGITYPYYIEKTMQTVGTNNMYYYAKIKSVMVTLPDGTTERQPLKSDTKYYIKVRAVRVDPTDTTLVAYSKYDGPVDTRTQFNQQDYDDKDQVLKGQAKFLDRISRIEESNYWRLRTVDGTTSDVILKGDKFVNQIQNSNSGSITFDMTSINQSAGNVIVYIPVGVIRALNTSGKSLLFNAPGIEFTLRPKSLDIDSNGLAKSLLNITGAKDIFYKLTLVQTDLPSVGIPTETNIVSKAANFKVGALASSKSDSDLKNKFHDKIYNDETGLVKEKMDLLLSSAIRDSSDFSQRVDTLINGYVNDILDQLSDYVKLTVEGNSSVPGMMLYNNAIMKFDVPMVFKQMYTIQSGNRAPYVYYESSPSWKRLSGSVTDKSGSLSFPVTGTGVYSVFATSEDNNDLPDSYQEGGTINKFLNKYSIWDVFTGMYGYEDLQLRVSGKDAVLLVEKVTGKSNAYKGLDIKQKIIKLHLSTIISNDMINKNISREMLAGLLIKVYANKLGIKVDKLKLSKNITIRDDSTISSKFYKSVLITVDKKMLSLDSKRYFSPKAYTTRDEVITAFTGMLVATGDITI